MFRNRVEAVVVLLHIESNGSESESESKGRLNSELKLDGIVCVYVGESGSILYCNDEDSDVSGLGVGKVGD